MAMALDELRAPEPDPELEIVQREDYVTMAKLNEIAWGYPPGDFDVVASSRIPGFRHYFGSLDGEVVCCLGFETHGTDAVVEWVAAVPEARGRGISGRVLAHALEDAREAGLETTSLQSSPLGYPVYSKLGYRDYGTVNMWERRKADD
jgi:GNAT superfamily N-acetyltransferase